MTVKALVAAPFIPISRFPHSHRGAQGVIYADMVRNTGRDVTCNMSLDLYHPDFNEFDEMWVYHGNDWTGRLNIFGGMDKFPYAKNFENFSRFRGKIYSLGIDFPDYHKMVAHKIDLVRTKDPNYPVQEEWLNLDWENLSTMRERAVTVRYPLVTDKLVLGDSHAICMYRPGWFVESIPFKTLYGATRIGLESMLPACYGGWGEVSAVELYFGNIDVRHHIMRQPDPDQAVRDLAAEYHRQAKALATLDGHRTVRIYELLPIEDESRTIPKTGNYEGEPFFGSWAERDRARLLFRQELEELAGDPGVEVYRWVDHLYNEKRQLSFAKMERPKSIHLSRDAYPFWQGEEWNGKPAPDVLI